MNQSNAARPDAGGGMGVFYLPCHSTTFVGGGVGVFSWLLPTPRMILTLYYTKVRQHRTVSILGIVLMFIFVLQLVSGTMLSFSLNCDPMNVPISRSEEDMDDLYADDFFWLHERGVDFIFIFIFAHMLRKFYLSSFTRAQEGAWKTGATLFLFLHVVTFFGLVLCCTHLSEVTLTIAANIAASLVAKHGKIYWWIFPAQELNFDTMVRLMYGHYTSAFILFAVSTIHSLEMHYDWKDTSFNEQQQIDLSWWDDAVKSETFGYSKYMIALFYLGYIFYHEVECLGVELFMWGDTGPINDIRFYGVTPHWYFRAYMSWLVACPHHYIGLLGLGLFMVAIYFQPNVKSTMARTALVRKESALVSKWHNNIFTAAIFYSASYLPHGKFFNRIGGNPATLASFLFILYYLLISLNWYFRIIGTYFNRLLRVVA